jgi:hypothetical protein
VDITTPSVYEHEIAKHSDFQDGFESIIRNTAILDRMLVSAEYDYVIGGKLTPAAGSLAFTIGKMWGNGLALDLPVFNNALSDPIPLSPPVSDERIDTVQIRAVLEESDRQRRAFFNPETESGQYYNTPTKKRLKIEWGVLQGTEGALIAPDAEPGWLKLAEIIVAPGMTTLPIDNIKPITAIYQGEENTAWTNQKKRTFSLGSQLELKTILALEHTITGEHRANVIHAGNIDLGPGSNQLNAQKIPLGETYTAGTDIFNGMDSLFACLVKEIGYRRSCVATLAAAVSIINTTIADMVHEAPQDGSTYGRKNNGWIALSDSSGGGGITGDAIKALKFFSHKTLMITNAQTALRRQRGWDIGLPYPSPASKVYHFDTDLNDQNQETALTITHTGTEPALVDNSAISGSVYLSPAMSEEPPYEMPGKSLHGHCSLAATPPTATNTFSAEVWTRFFDDMEGILLRLESPSESLTLRIAERGSADGPEYSAADTDAIAYSQAESDGIAYSQAATSQGNTAVHQWGNNNEETAILYDAGIDLPAAAWIHIAAVATQNILSLFIGESRIDFERKTQSAQLFSLTLNPDRHELNLDELLLDATAAIPFDQFTANTSMKIPYAALDYREKWLVLEAQNTAQVKTNLFETDAFRAAVAAAIADLQGV